MEEQEYLEQSVEETAQAGETEDSASSEPVEDETEPQEEVTEPEPQKRKQSVQERIDQAIWRQREAERERDYYRELARAGIPKEAPEQEQPAQELPMPRSEDFDTYDQFVDAKAVWAKEAAKREFKAEQEAARQVDIQRREAERVTGWMQQGGSKYQDWQDVFNQDTPISDPMKYALLDSDMGHDLAYYLGKNPAEARRIYGLPAHRQLYEMGKLEARLSGPPQKTKTNAPRPTSPVGGKEVPSKRLEDMSDDEYVATREKKLGYR